MGSFRSSNFGHVAPAAAWQFALSIFFGFILIGSKPDHRQSSIATELGPLLPHDPVVSLDVGVLLWLPRLDTEQGNAWFLAYSMKVPRTYSVPLPTQMVRGMASQSML